jgi:PAS domain S-box-containing protein
VTIPRRILIVEDSVDDAELAVRALRQSGLYLTYERVDTPETMRAALEERPWDVVLSDFSMPRFSGLDALKLLQDRGFDLPFILVSGTVGEDVAVQAMRAGAHDYFLKGNLTRLPLAVERELRDAETRRETKRAEARYRTLFNRVPLGITSTTPEGVLLAANPAFVQMLGFADVEELKRANVAEFWVNPEERDQMNALLARDGLIQHFELQLRRKDGTAIWCAVSTRAVYDAAAKMESYEGVTVDITDRKRAEEEITRARDLALETVRLRSEFMHNVSHEIRTPLNGIIGTAEILLLDDDLTPKQRHGIEIIQSSSELLLTIVNDILDFSKLSADKVVLEKLDFSLVEVVEGIIDSFAETAHAKKIDLAVSMDANLPAGVRGDPNRLRQILNNLISNAIKFISVGGVLVHATKAEESNDQVLVRFEVIDTGIGIPLEVQDRLFQPFAQAEGSTSRHYGGTGLGLVISAQLAKQMGGEIGFESTPGKGSNFHFTVRLEKGGKTTRPLTTTSAGPHSPRLGVPENDSAEDRQRKLRKDVRVLVVEDNNTNRTVVTAQLGMLGYSAEVVDRARLGLEALSLRHHSIVLMDCGMPEMDGYEATREIRRREGNARHTVVIALTAHATEGDRERCLDAGMDDYISKPVKLEALMEMLDSWSRRVYNTRRSPAEPS